MPGSASNDASNILLEARQAMLLARLQMGLLPPEGPRKYFLLSQSDPVRANEWMTAREALELATLGGARVLGRSDIGSTLFMAESPQKRTSPAGLVGRASEMRSALQSSRERPVTRWM